MRSSISSIPGTDFPAARTFAMAANAERRLPVQFHRDGLGRRRHEIP